MKKKLCMIMAAAMIASVGVTACSSKPAETTAAETTVEETTVEETTAEETTEAEESSEAEESAEDELSEDELAAMYQAFAESLQKVIGQKDLKQLAELVVYPCYVGIDDGVVVENEDEFLALDAEKVFTDELIAAVEGADLENTEVTEAGYVVGDPSGKPNVTFGLDAEGTMGITGINY